MKYIVFALVFILAISNSFGEGQKRRRKGHDKMFGRMDSDKDGNLSKKEWSEYYRKEFDKIDVNKDGKLTKSEKKTYLKKRKSK